MTDLPERDDSDQELQRHLQVADQVLELVLTRLPEATPQTRDLSDELLCLALGRAYRCLRSIRELASHREGDDVAILTRALVALTLRYLWLASTDDEDERQDRLRRLRLLWASGRATLGEEMIDLDYHEEDPAVEAFRAEAKKLREEGVGQVKDKEIALQLDRDLQPDPPRFFEGIYTSIYRPMSEVAHFGLGTALAGYMQGRGPEDGASRPFDEVNEKGAAQGLGLAIVTFGALLVYSEPVIRHGLADEAGEIVRDRHLVDPAGEQERS
jgi:hypothetical protein